MCRIGAKKPSGQVDVAWEVIWQALHHDRAICAGKCLQDPYALVLSYSHAQLQSRSPIQSLIKLGNV